jgi:hypothetical protein
MESSSNSETAAIASTVHYQRETLSQVYEDLMPLWNEHWQETEKMYMDAPRPVPDIDLVEQYEMTDAVVAITARNHEGVAIGYLIFVLSPSLHESGKMLATEDGFFVTKEWRKSMVAASMMTMAEAILHSMSVDYAYMTDKVPVGGKDLTPLFRRRGYFPIARVYVKKFGD